MAGASGRLDVICGCMFSGKTSLLIERLNEARRAGRRVGAFKHALDARYDPKALATHDGRCFPATSVADAEALLGAARGLDVVGVDEVHFFGSPILPIIATFISDGASLWLAGIDFDAWGRPLPPMAQLKLIAAAVHVRTAPCGICGHPARLSQRMSAVQPGDDMVGGLQDYSPRCATCFRPVASRAPVY
jgi:thymidine kinase